jgi:hypothetical protein
MFLKTYFGQEWKNILKIVESLNPQPPERRFLLKRFREEQKDEIPRPTSMEDVALGIIRSAGFSRCGR